MSEPVFTCERCGFTGPDGGTGCPHCAMTVAFRAPAAAPAVPGAVAFAAAEAGGAGAGGYVDLDLGSGEHPLPAAPARAAPPPLPPTGRPIGARTSPSFAAVPRPPQLPRSAVPVLSAVGVGCLALIAVGVFLAGRAAAPDAPAPAVASAAPAAEPSREGAPPAPEPAPSPAPSASPPAPVEAARPPQGAPAAVPRPARAAAPRAPAASDPRRAREEASAAAAEPPRPPVVVAALQSREPVESAPVAAAPPVEVAPAAVPLPPPPTPIEEAPRTPSEGFRAPQMAEPGCVQRSVRLPREATSRITGPVTVRFAVGPSGDVGLFQVYGEGVDTRVIDALAAAVRGCRFLPGTDAQGTPTRLWVAMPIRFER